MVLICPNVSGYSYIWNLFDKIGTAQQRCETLDWYHLGENLWKTDLNEQLLHEIKQLLWDGEFAQALDILQSSQNSGVANFLAYIQKHQHRIPCYSHFHDKAIPIGAGAVESLVKQIDRRGQISGAQWASKNVPQVLKQRSAYL